MPCFLQAFAAAAVAALAVENHGDGTCASQNQAEDVSLLQSMHSMRRAANSGDVISTVLVDAKQAPQGAGTPIASLGAEDQSTAIVPFGREDTAKELQTHAARTQDTLVDAVENAEVAEIKRAVFRSLTRLRAAEIKEFDTIARLETQAIDEYNDNHHFRAENPLEPLSARDDEVSSDKLTSFHE